MQNGGDQEYLRFIEEIYTKLGRTNELIQNIKQELVNLNSRSWLENPIGNDILVGMNNIDGFSSDILVVFQDDDPNRFEHNVCMRAKIFLIVVYIPYKPFSEFCFCVTCAICGKDTAKRWMQDFFPQMMLFPKTFFPKRHFSPFFLIIFLTKTFFPKSHFSRRHFSPLSKFCEIHLLKKKS